MSYWVALFAMIGLIMGSFANVLIYRLPRMIAEPRSDATHHPFNLCWPASHCQHCKTTLRFWQNIPLLSFLVLKGRCAHCKTRISIHYPLVEILCAGLWALCAWHWGGGWTALSWSVFATVLLALSVMDWQTQLLPDDLTQGLLWLGLMASTLGWIELPLQQAVWGAAVGYVSLWLVAYVFEKITQKQGMGAGDFKFLAALGAWLGPWALIPLVFLASTAGALTGLGLILARRMQRQDYLPFGPFLAVAGAAVGWLGNEPLVRFLNALFIA